MEEQKLTTPVAIIIIGVIIAGAIIFSNSQKKDITTQPPTDISKETPKATSNSTDKVAQITKEDHIRGDINAPIKIVEYSDFECPFCQRFHQTMKQVMDEYGKKRKVAWVYRHFPLDQLHPKNARKAAIASECVAEQAGNDTFWLFADEYFASTPANDRAGDSLIPEIAKDIGLDMAEFEKCRTSGKYDKHIKENITNAVETGGQGTPWSIVIMPNGETVPISGAQSYESIKQLIDSVIGNK